MIVDLQGVQSILTDPQIHTYADSDTSYGMGNLGTEGMAAFFATHKCNGICNLMNLKHPDDSSRASIETKESTREKAEMKLSESSSVKLSCPLCGQIFCAEREKFIELAKEDRQLYCPPCQTKITAERSTATCACKKKFDYSAYWYLMIGMAPPRTCKECKYNAAKAAAIAAASKEST